MNMSSGESTLVDIEQRQCGRCEACCFVAEVKEGVVQKPACQKCPFQNNGCSIFGKETRPNVCKDFQCSWLRGHGDQSDRPDLSQIMVSVNNANNGTWIFALELSNDSHQTTGRNILESMLQKYDLPIIVVKNSNLKSGLGDYVIIKDTLESRSKQLKGEFIDNFTPHAKRYYLHIS